MTRAAIYARISSDRDHDEVGVDRQTADCEALIAERGWTTTATYRDTNKSAMRGRRPEFERMLTELDRIDVIVVWSADRLYRRLTELERLVSELGRVQVATVRSGEVDLSTADGRAVARLLGTFAQRESEKLSERVARAALDRAMQGRHHGGRRAIGFEPDGSPRESELADLRRALAGLDAGDTLGSVCRSVGVDPMQAHILKRALRNPRLIGQRRYRGETVPGTGVPLVDPEQWQRVQARIAATGRGRPPVTLLSGIASCAVCGGWLRGDGRSRGDGSELVYACCTSRKRTTLDAMATSLAVQRLQAYGPELAALAADPPSAPRDADADRVRRELDALAAMLKAGGLSAAAYAAAASALEASAAPAPVPPRDAVGDEARRLLAGGDPAAAWDAAPVGVRRQVLRVLLDRIEVDRGRGTAGVLPIWRAAG